MEVLTHFPLLKALGWALFNSLWQMAALWLLYIVLVSIFQSATVRHRFALFFLGAGAIWTGVSFFAAWLFPGNVDYFILSILSPARTASDGFWQSGRHLVEEALPYGSSLYLLILSGLVVRYGTNYRHSRRLTRLGLSAMPPQFRTFVSSTALQLGIKTPVQAWLSSLIDVPLTLGFLKPVILVPAAMITHLTPQQVEAILVHELAHIRRKDYLLHLLVTMLEGLFFFNPFARLLIRQLKRERENCCDDLVLQFKYDAHAYVSALLSLASAHQPLHRLAVAATGAGDRMLLQRAKRILLQQKGDRLSPGARPLLLLIFTLVIAALTLYHPLLQTRKSVPVTATRTSASDYRNPGTSTYSGTSTYFSPKASALSRQETTRLLARVAPQFPGTRTTAVAPRASSMNTPVGGSARFSRAATVDAPSIHPTDFAFNRRIISTVPFKAIRHQISRNRTVSLRGHPNGGMTGVTFMQSFDNDLFVSTADDGFAFGNSDGVPATTATTAGPDGDAEPNADNRDFSMDIPQVGGPARQASQQGMPFIPNSSFSFLYTTSDSTHPDEQLLYLQQSAQLDVLAAIAKLQRQTFIQLNALSVQLSKASESVPLQKTIRSRQIQLEENYLKKIMSWQEKLQKTTHVRMIVYI